MLQANRAGGSIGPGFGRAVQVISGKRAAEVTDDGALLRRVASRDHSAFAELYHRYSDKLHGFAFQILQNRQEAEEALQDAFVQIWKRAPSYDPEKAAPFTWSVMLVRSLCIDRLRARRRRQVLLERWEQNQAAPGMETPDGARVLAAHELAGRIAAALTKLPDEQWEPIKLAFYKGLTQWEIAARTNQPVGTVKSRIRRGMLKLRELLRDIYA